MSSHAIIYHGILLVGGAFCVGVGSYAWRQREQRGAKLLAGMFAALVFWMFSTSLVIHFAGRPIVQPIARSQYLAITLVPMFLFMVTLRYTGREQYLTRQSFALLLVHPVLANVAVWVPPFRESFMRFGESSASSFFGYAVGYGLLFQVHTLYSYLLMGSATVMLVTFAVRSEHIYQRQVVAILVGVFAPWVGNALYLYGPISVDITSLAFAVTGLALWWAIFSEDFLEIVPVARNTVVDNIGAGVFVLDRDNRVVDINPKGRTLFRAENDDVIGRDVRELLAGYPTVQNHFERITDTHQEATTEVSFGSNTYQVEISPLYDQHDAFIGRLFLINDVTDQKRRQRELERQNEQLEQFANVVSHDLRNPLNVAAGKLELGLATDDREHYEDVQDAHERMSRIIDDVLTLARQGQQVEERSHVSLQSLANNAWRNVDTPGAKLQLTGDCEFEADRTRLLRVFENLFRNAVEHSSTGNQNSKSSGDALEHGREDATLTVGPTEGGFFVADDGPGIPEARRDDVFDDGYTTNEEGTGFGLSIVESIVEAHGWDIRVTESDDGGARFEVTGIAPLSDNQTAGQRGEGGTTVGPTESMT